MRRSLFALLRGPDGRSLGRALACLLLLNAVVVGLHSGMAAAATDAVLCTVDMGDGSHDGGSTAPDHRPPCCPPALSNGFALPASAPALLLPDVVDAKATPPAWQVPAARTALPSSARGPPLLA